MGDLLNKIVTDDYTIQPNIAIAADGGTISFRVMDCDGDIETLYLDRRLGTETKDIFYKDAYPEREGSVYLGKNDALVEKIESACRSEASTQQV